MRDHLRKLANAREALNLNVRLIGLNQHPEIIIALAQKISRLQNEISELEKEAAFLEEMRKEGVVGYAVLIDTAPERSYPHPDTKLWKTFPLGDEERMYAEATEECARRWPNYEFTPEVYGGVLLSCRRRKQGTGTSIYTIEVQPYKADDKLSSVWLGHVRG